MHGNKRDLINHLFAIATGLLNETEGLAVRGQSPTVSSEDVSTVSADVLAKLEDTTAIVKAVQVIAGN